MTLRKRKFALVFGYLSSKNSSTLKKLLSDNVISGVLKEA